MLSEVLRIKVSKRCQYLLALAFLKRPDEIKTIAAYLESDDKFSAIKLAEALAVLPEKQARELCEQTLSAIGYPWNTGSGHLSPTLKQKTSQSTLMDDVS